MDPQIAWAAGIFEGEGCITRNNMDDNQPVLQLRMTDKDIVERFVDIMGYGNIVIEHPPGDRKTVYCWRIARKSEVRRCLDMMLPLLGERRAYKALNALDAIEL
jgi:hypothetical protein